MIEQQLNQAQRRVLSGMDTEWRSALEIAKRSRHPRYQTPWVLRKLFEDTPLVERRKETPGQNFLWRVAPRYKDMVW